MNRKKDDLQTNHIMASESKVTSCILFHLSRCSNNNSNNDSRIIIVRIIVAIIRVIIIVIVMCFWGWM